MTQPQPRLELSGITRALSGDVANDRVGAPIAPGEIHALRDANGAGKSALVKMMRGVLALAQVVFSSWKPGRHFLGAYLFGLAMTMELHLKAAGIRFVAPEFLAALPCLATIVVLAFISWQRHERTKATAGLGKPFQERP